MRIIVEKGNMLDYLIYITWTIKVVQLGGNFAHDFLTTKPLDFQETIFFNDKQYRLIMEKRFKMIDVQPDAYRAMRELSKYVAATGVAPLHLEMIKIRASQINGCAYCLNMHARDARNLGEAEQRIYLLSAWRDAPIFTEEERLMLEMTEEITLIHRRGLSDEVYQRSIALFGEEKTAQIIMTIVTINAWNRIMVSLQTAPE
jgi:AhpD family alkylhydroperoxidase